MNSPIKSENNGPQQSKGCMTTLVHPSETTSAAQSLDRLLKSFSLEGEEVFFQRVSALYAAQRTLSSCCIQ